MTSMGEKETRGQFRGLHLARLVAISLVRYEVLGVSDFGVVHGYFRRDMLQKHRGDETNKERAGLAMGFVVCMMATAEQEYPGIINAWRQQARQDRGYDSRLQLEAKEGTHGSEALQAGGNSGRDEP